MPHFQIICFHPVKLTLKVSYVLTGFRGEMNSMESKFSEIRKHFLSGVNVAKIDFVSMN